MDDKEKKVMDSIEKLSQSLDIKINKKKNLPTFKTKEVVCLLLFTALIGLAMGGIVTYNVVLKGEKVDDELQEFITNYDYIVDNYYGDVDKTKLVEKLSNEKGKKISPFVALRELRKTITNFVVSGCMEE